MADEKFVFKRLRDSAICTVGLVKFFQGEKKSFEVLLTAVWQNETMQFAEKKFLDRGVMPPEFFSQTKAVNEQYLFMHWNDGLWYYYLASVTFHDVNGKILHRETFEDSLPNPVASDNVMREVFYYAMSLNYQSVDFVTPKKIYHSPRQKADYDDYDPDWFRGDNSFVNDFDDYDERRRWAEVEEDEAYERYAERFFDD